MEQAGLPGMCGGSAHGSVLYLSCKFVMSMRDWLEIEARFRRLAEPLQQMRLDFQWGAAGEYWRLAGVSGSPTTKEFEAIAAIAGRHLESVLPKQGEVFERINGESSTLHKWYRAVKELTEDFKFGLLYPSKSK